MELSENEGGNFEMQQRLEEEKLKELEVAQIEPAKKEPVEKVSETSSDIT